MSFTEKGVVEEVVTGLGSIITNNRVMTRSKMSAGSISDRFVPEWRVKEVTASCVNVKSEGALLGFHADRVRLDFFQL